MCKSQMPGKGITRNSNPFRQRSTQTRREAPPNNGKKHCTHRTSGIGYLWSFPIRVEWERPLLIGEADWRVPKHTRQIRVMMMPNGWSHNHAIVYHVIMSGSKNVVTCRRELQSIEALCRANAIAVPHHLAPLELAGFSQQKFLVHL